MTLIKITCGAPDDHYGKTTFRVTTDGSIDIKNTHLGKHSEYKDRQSAEHWQVKADALAEHRDMNAVALRKGTAHEALYEISVGDDHTNGFTLTVWHNDLKKYPAINAVVREAKACVKKSSDGQLQL
jgi:hypothetical protein